MVKLPTGRHTQAIKSAKQNEGKRLRNKSYKSRVKTAVKNFNSLIADGSKEEALKTFSETSSLIDTTASKGVIHKNKAARLKSRMAKKLNSPAFKKPPEKS